MSVPWDKLEKLFNKVGEVIVKGGEHFWPLAVKQRLIAGTYQAILVVIFLVGAVVALYCCLQEYHKYTLEENYNKKDGYSTGAFVLGLVSFACVVTVLVLAYFALSNLLNPEWAAFYKILELVGN